MPDEAKGFAHQQLSGGVFLLNKQRNIAISSDDWKRLTLKSFSTLDNYLCTISNYADMFYTIIMRFIDKTVKLVLFETWREQKLSNNQ